MSENRDYLVTLQHTSSGRNDFQKVQAASATEASDRVLERVVGPKQAAAHAEKPIYKVLEVVLDRRAGAGANAVTQAQRDAGRARAAPAQVPVQAQAAQQQALRQRRPTA